ncbi:centrosomal protein of 164 kDa-like isoform X2 [Scyliorhinus torazame]|uniref:centrosomal protein of 164 kDa-like isoform X2 n=1 Tax=Scyliorhinus torazame TaxID=75743 RepID=UPI003B58C9C0
MTASALRIGDQLILEEDYDENYIPNEQEIQEYAREIGIDPENEPELMWLAREGIVAPLPQEWKPCQDITGDVYYFNFVSGQSTWDHPCDEQYRNLVSLEREKLHALGGSKKKEKKKKKDKKEKKEKEPFKSTAVQGLPQTLVQAPQGGLAPLRGLGEVPASTLYGSLANTSGTTAGLMKSSLGSSNTFRIPKTGGLTSTLLGEKHEGKISMNLADFSDDDEDLSGEKSAPDTAQLLKNLHIDVGTLGDGFEYEESAEIDEDADHDHVDEETEPELQNLPGSDEEAESQKEVSFEQSQGRSEPGSVLDSKSRDVQPPTPNKLNPDKEADDDIDSVDEKRGVQDKSGSDTEGDVILVRAEQPGHQGRAVAIDEEANEEIGAGDSRCDSVDNSSKLPPVGEEELTSEHQNGGDPKLRCVTERASIDGEINAGNGPNGGARKDSVMPGSNPDESGNPPLKESEPSQQLKDLLQASEDLDESDTNFDLGIQIQAVKRLLGVETPSPPLDQQLKSECEDRDGEKLNLEDDERRKRAEAAERRIQDKQKQEHELMDRGSLQTQESVEDLQGTLSEELGKEEGQILCEKEEQLCKLRDKLRQEEEEQTQQIYRENEDKLRLLKEQLRIEREEEEARLKEEQRDRLLKLQIQMKKEIEATEKEMRADNEATLQQLRGELRLLQETKQQSLEDKKNALLEQMRKETDLTLNEEKVALEKKKEKAHNELRQQLEKKMKEELEELENKHARDIQGLKAITEEKHQELLTGLRKQMADAHSIEEAQLQRDLQKSQRKMQQIADYERELSDLLKEKREEVEKDHEWKTQQIKEEHEQTVDRIRVEYEEEERQQRSRLLKQLQAEHERLTQFHERELSELRQELDHRLDDLRKFHGEKELKVQEAEEQLEMRAKELKAKSNLLHNQEMSLKLQREQFHAEENQLQREQAEILSSRPSKQEVEQSKREHSSLQDSIRKSHQNLNKLQDQQVALQLEVDTLREESQQLQNKISELEITIRKKHETLKEVPIINGTSDDAEEDELHIEDLNFHIEANPNCSSSPIPRVEDEEVSMENVRYYISAEGLSINKAKEFLMRQTRSLRKRQTALKSAKQQWRHDMRKAQEDVQDPESTQILQDAYRNLEQEAQHLDEMKLTMKKGQVLLQKKEQKLNQLESSLAEGISDEDTPRGRGDKKAVTFDLTDSDDISSIASVDSPQKNLKAELSLAQRANIQYLSDSVQKITSDLNSVLCVLGSLGMQQSPLFSTTQALSVPPPSNSVPLSVYTSLTRTQNSGSLLPSGTVPLPSQWIWNRGTNATSHLPTAQSVDDALSEKWRKYFPGGIPTLSRSSTPLESRLGYVSASDQVKMLQKSHSKITHGDRSSIQGMIDANKKWLEGFKKDPKIPLFTRTSRTPSTQGLIQLGLDENNQIKVYHF